MFKNFFKPSCVQCLQPSHLGYNLCMTCQLALPWLDQSSLCQRCALPLAESTDNCCVRCIQNPPVFDRAYALLSYDKTTAHFLHQYKFQHQLHYGKILAALLGQAAIQLEHSFVATEAIIPVPLHYWRQVKRGFNQCVQLAKPLAKTVTLPLDTRYVLKCRRTKAQHTLSGVQREANVTNVFKVGALRSYQHVTLIDDVMTTGETLNALARCLKNTYPSLTIQVVCLLRATVKL